MVRILYFSAISFGLLACLVLVHCRDFYMGMFKRNDVLVVQDYMYKERMPFRRMYGKYLKVVRCPISYLRVVDRLGVGSGPTVRILRGGLKKNHVYLYIMSAYNQPLSVTIYIGCPRSTKTTVTTESLVTVPGDGTGNETAAANGTASGNDTVANDGAGNGDGAGDAPGDAAGETTAAAAADGETSAAADAETTAAGRR